MRHHFRLIPLAVVLIGVLGLTACAEEPTSQVTAPDAADVRLSTASDGEELETTGAHIVLFRAHDIPARFRARVEALGGAVESADDDLGIATVTNLDDRAAERLQRSGDIQFVEPDVLIEPGPAYVDEEPVASEEDAERWFWPPNTEEPTRAFRYNWQWHMRAIDADDAWAAGYLGSSDVTVAILDTGIDYTHSDLFDLVDLDRSRSFVPREDRRVRARYPDAHPIADIRGHGTHVAATVSSNAAKTAGVTSKTTLVGLKVCGRGCPVRRIYQAIRYAADNGADVINMSLGGAYKLRHRQGLAAVVNRVINYAYRNGVVVVVSAGNGRVDLDHDEDGFKTYCSAARSVCVAATGPTSGGRAGPWENVDAPARYTNHGRSAITVAAPGGNRGGSVRAACTSFSSFRHRWCRRSKGWVIGMRGTSMAAPHVSGIAALLVAKYGKDNPGRVITAIQQAADDLGDSGTDPYYGKGRINVAKALGVE